MNNRRQARIALLCSGLVLLALTAFFTWTTSRSESAQPLNAETAKQKAEAFLRSAGIAVPNLPVSIEEVESLFGRKRWQVKWGDAYTVQIDAVTGEVRTFSNERRAWEQAKGVGRTGKTFYRSREEALQYVTRLAKQFGLPRSAVLKKFSCYADGESPHADASKAGYVAVTFHEKPFGYSSLSLCPENHMYVEVDAQDGTLVFFRWAWDTVQVESHTVSFPKGRAVEKAKQVYADYYRHRRSPHKGSYTGKVELGYVRPNGLFGGKQYPDQVPFRLRLAWAVYFGEESVWIDAGDGSILGGAIFK